MCSFDKNIYKDYEISEEDKVQIEKTTRLVVNRRRETCAGLDSKNLSILQKNQFYKTNVKFNPQMTTRAPGWLNSDL